MSHCQKCRQRTHDGECPPPPPDRASEALERIACALEAIMDCLDSRYGINVHVVDAEGDSTR